MKSSEIRKKYLDFFEAKGHKIFPGSSLIPKDPTVLLTLAGMLQFKGIFLGQEKPAYKRVTTVQKCIRLIDVERVGKTRRHHTFFEMLGNFSFGDYFKKEAIQFAWELLSKEFRLPVTKLKVAVYEKDDEAFNIWHQNIGLPKEIIFRLDEENNFWAAGPTGPCGPCSEIYYDLGPAFGCGKPNCAPGCDCNRFLEIWNLVFIQYNRNEKGELLPLKQKGIDTGMGLERIAAVLQGVDNNFETDLFIPLIHQLESLASGEGISSSVKVVADHIRAIAHLIVDGVFPANAGRGYVLRRLIRRAVLHGKLIGINPPFLTSLLHELVKTMQDFYPQLHEKELFIAKIIGQEETVFSATLEQGMKYFHELTDLLTPTEPLSGKAAFKLHDTYGFPVELTNELLEKRGLKLNFAEFEEAMSAQRQRARSAGISAEKKAELSSLDLSNLPATKFTGYEKIEEESKVQALFPEQNIVVIEKTPFYGESGGQAGDSGIFLYNKQETIVVDTLISPKGTILHLVEKTEGLKVGEKIKAEIDPSLRQATAIHHTATHLLHKALKEVLGDHIKQAGSYVGPDKLRFDFNNLRALTHEELQKIEQIVNKKINEKIKVDVLQKSYHDAIKMGATALFGEKYGDKVRVLKIGEYSLELCGGTHVKNTDELLFFKIFSEGAVGSGVRRIEAIAGQAAKIYVIYQAKSSRDEVDNLIKQYRKLQREKEGLGGVKSLETNIFEIEVTELDRLSKAVDSQDSLTVSKFMDHLLGRVDWLKERVAKTEKEIEALKLKQTKENASNFLAEAKEISGYKVLLKDFPGYTMEMLRSLSDSLQASFQSCVLALVSTQEGKASFLVSVTPDLVEKGILAKDLAAKLSENIQGRSGGKETKAEGGGKAPDQLPKGFAEILKLLAGKNSA